VRPPSPTSLHFPYTPLFRSTLRLLIIMKFDARNFTPEKLLRLYEAILKPRLIEEKMLILLRQNKISKWFSGIGQEAIAVGVTERSEEHTSELQSREKLVCRL